MTSHTWSASQRRSAAMFGFVLGDGVAGAYDGWSRPPTHAVVDLALHDPGPVQATERTTRLLDALREQGSDPSAASGPRGRPPALSPGHDDASPAGGHDGRRSASRVADDIVVAASAAGIVATSPARAAEAARYGVPIDGVASPLAVSDAAGVLAAAVGLAVTARLPSSAGSIADEVVPYAHTAEVRQQLDRIASLDPAVPATALRGLLDEPVPVYLVGVVLVAAGRESAPGAVHWATRTGGHPGPAAAAAGALVAARGPWTIVGARLPGSEIVAAIQTLTSQLSTMDQPPT